MYQNEFRAFQNGSSNNHHLLRKAYIYHRKIQHSPRRASPVVGAPALDETHADGAHSGELVDGLEALVDRLRQQRRELLVIEDFEIATCSVKETLGCYCMSKSALIYMYTS